MSIENRLQALEERLAFTEDLLGKLDDALAAQQTQLLEIQRRLGVAFDQIRELEQELPDEPEPPPPHY